MLRGLNSQLETYPAHFENEAIPYSHLPDQLRINTDTSIAQNPHQRST